MPPEEGIVPLFDSEEIALLQDAVAKMIADMLVRYGHLLDQPRLKREYEGYIEVGRKLGMEL